MICSPTERTKTSFFSDIRFIPKFESEGVKKVDWATFEMAISSFKPYLLNGARYDEGYCLSLIGNWMRFDCYQYQCHWMTLNGHYALTTKIWMKIDPYYHLSDLKCSPVFLVSSKIRCRLCGCSQEFAGEGTSNYSGVLENDDFCFFWRSLTMYVVRTFTHIATIIILYYTS